MFRKVLIGLMATLVTGFACAGALSNYLTNKIIDWGWRGATFVPATVQYIALSTVSGSAALCGNGSSEPSGGSYARIPIPATGTLSLTSGFSGTGNSTQTAASNGTSGATFNLQTITFANPTGNWGTIVEFCVFDAITSGNLLWRASLTTSKTVNSGDAAPSFAIGSLSETIN